MKLNKKLDSGTKRETIAWGFELAAVAVAIMIVVAIPVVLDLDTILSNPSESYHSFKFKVLMWLSAGLLVAVAGATILRGKAPAVPVLTPALALLGISALSTLFSEDPLYSFYGDRDEGLLSLSAGVLLFYALARGLTSPLRVRVFLAAAVTTAVLVALFGISQKYGVDMISGWSNRWYRDLGRPFSTIGNPITLAAYLTLMMGAATALCFKAGSSSSSSRHRWSWLFALAVLGACWIYTDTRGAMLGGMVGLPVILMWFSRKMGTVRPLLLPLTTLVGAMVAAVAASAAFGNLSPSVRFLDLLFSVRAVAALVLYLVFIGVVLWLSRRGTRAMRFLLVGLTVLAAAGIVAVATLSSGDPTLSEPSANSVTIDQNSQVRLYIWRDAIPMILDRPLLGHGPDNFAGPFESYMGEDLKAAISAPGGGVLTVDRVHNDSLQIAATTGLLGLAAYLWLLVSYFRNVYRRGGWPLISLSGGVLVYIFELQSAFPTAATNVAFWGLLGASVAIMRLQDQEESGSEPETVSPSTALTSPRSRTKLAEPLVVVIVVAVLAAIAVPTFLSQRAEAAEIQQAKVMVNVKKAVSAYLQVKEQSGTWPEDGVYTKVDPMLYPDGSLAYLPSAGVRITIDTAPGGGIIVEGESTSLSGTFRYSYDSATGTYTAVP